MTSVIELPFLVPSAKVGSKTIWEIYQNYLKAEYPGVKVLSMWVHSPGHIHMTKKQVKTLTILAIPFFLPLILRLGYDPIWFGVIVCVTNMIGIILPPMAINVFVVSGITKVPIGTIYRGVYPYLLGMSVCLLILLSFPQISLWLPNLLMK